MAQKMNPHFFEIGIFLHKNFPTPHTRGFLSLLCRIFLTLTRDNNEKRPAHTKGTFNSSN